MFEIIRIYRNGFRISEAYRHEHKKSDDIEMSERVYCETPVYFRSGVAVPQRNVTVREFVQNHGYYHHKGDKQNARYVKR